MNLPARAAAIIQQLWLLNVDLSNGDDDQRRALSKKIGEQVAFELGPQWGLKARWEGAPQSKDALAYNPTATRGMAVIDVWDWQNGATRQVQVSAGSPPTYPAITAWFTVVTPVNHLGTPTPDLPPPPPVVTPVLDHVLTEIDQRLLLIETSQSAIIHAITEMLDQQARGVTGRVSFLGTVTLKPPTP